MAMSSPNRNCAQRSRKPADTRNTTHPSQLGPARWAAAAPRSRPRPGRLWAADGRSFRDVYCARSRLRRMLRGGEGRGADSGTRRRSAISVQAPPPFSRRLSVLVGCAALRPAGQRFVLLGDGRVRATAGVGGGVGRGLAAAVLPARWWDRSARRVPSRLWGVGAAAARRRGDGRIPAAGGLEREALRGVGKGSSASSQRGPLLGSWVYTAGGFGPRDPAPSSVRCWGGGPAAGRARCYPRAALGRPLASPFPLGVGRGAALCGTRRVLELAGEEERYRRELFCFQKLPDSPLSSSPPQVERCLCACRRRIVGAKEGNALEEPRGSEALGLAGSAGGQAECSGPEVLDPDREGAAGCCLRQYKHSTFLLPDAQQAICSGSNREAIHLVSFRCVTFQLWEFWRLIMVISGCSVGSYKSGRRGLGADECYYTVECFHTFIFCSFLLLWWCFLLALEFCCVV